MSADLQVECDVGAPQVNYRESISKTADIKYVHKKQSGGSGQFAEVSIRFEPGEPGTGFEFRSEIKGGTVPKEYIPGVTKVYPSSLHCKVCPVTAVALGCTLISQQSRSARWHAVHKKRCACPHCERPLLLQVAVSGG